MFKMLINSDHNNVNDANKSFEDQVVQQVLYLKKIRYRIFLYMQFLTSHVQFCYRHRTLLWGFSKKFDKFF